MATRKSLRQRRAERAAKRGASTSQIREIQQGRTPTQRARTDRPTRGEIARTTPTRGSGPTRDGNLTRRGRPVAAPRPGEATPLPQQEREDARLAKIESFSGPKVFNDPNELQSVFDAQQKDLNVVKENFVQNKSRLDEDLGRGLITAEEYKATLAQEQEKVDAASEGLITQDQFNVAKSRLESGFSGVDPLGFRAEGLVDEEGRIVDKEGRNIATPQTKFDPSQSPSAQAAQRVAGPPTSPEARTGKMSRAEELGAIVNAPAPDLSDYDPNKNSGITKGQILAEDQARRVAAREELNQLQEEERRKGERSEQIGGASSEASEQTKQLNQQANAIKTNVALESVLSGIPTNAPGGEALANGYRQSYQLKQGAEDFIIANQQGRLNQLDTSFNNIGSIINRAKNEARANYSVIDNALQQSLDRSNQLLAKEKADAANKLAFDEDKLVRQEKAAVAKQIDKMTASLALRGGFGSSSGLREIRDAELDGEQAIIDLQAQFSFKRTDLSNAYTAAYNKAQETYQTNTISAWTTMQNKLSQLDLQGIASEQAKATARDKIFGDLISQVADIRKQKADDIKSAAKDLRELLQEEAKLKSDSVIGTGDTLEQITDITKEINGNKFISNAREVDTRFRSILGAVKSIEIAEESGDLSNKNFADQALINLFNKITDPGSVVRESEFARSAAGQPVLSRFETLFRKVREGGVLEPDARNELVRTAEVLSREYNKQLENDLQPYINRIDIFNSQPNVTTPIHLQDVIPPNLIPQVTDSQYSTWKAQANGEGQGVTPSGGKLTPQSNLYDFFSVYAPSADNNNPTAYAEAVAKDLGIDANTSLGSLTGKVSEMAQAIADHEGFTSGASRLAVVNNNPGNLRYIGQASADLGEGGFARFDSVEAGMQALESDIRAKISGRSRATIPQYADIGIVFEGDVSGDSAIIEEVQVDTSNFTGEDLKRLRDAKSDEERETIKRKIAAVKLGTNFVPKSKEELIGQAVGTTARNIATGLAIGTQEAVERYKKGAMNIIISEYLKFAAPTPQGTQNFIAGLQST